MAAELSFEELFEHLGEYVPSKDYRWKLCMRVKRALSNTDDSGGIGHDQVYFEGGCTNGHTATRVKSTYILALLMKSAGHSF